MTWNYRVIELTGPDGEPWRAIYEVYYNEDGGPNAHTSRPATVGGDDGTDLAWILDRMREALDKPVLTQKDFPNAV